MKRRIHYALCLLALCTASALSLHAQQWTAQKSGTTADIWSARFTDAKTGCAATWNQDEFSMSILRTTNGGATWSTVFQDMPRGATAVDFADNNTGVVVGGSFDYLVGYRTTNGGSTWSSMFSDGQHVVGKPAIWSVSFGDDKTGYASASGGVIMKTTNAGAGWSLMSTRVAVDKEIIHVHFTSASTGYAIAANAQDYYRGRELYKTTDGAQSWHKLASLPLLRSVVFLNDDVGFAAGSNGGRPTIWKTVDGGETWQAKYSGPGDSPWMNDITFTPENPYVGYAVGGSPTAKNNGLIVGTVDGGETWTVEASNLPYNLRSVEFPTETTGYALGDNGGIYKTTRDPQPPPKPTILVSEEEVDFGLVTVGESFDLWFDITPGSPVPLEVTSIALGESAAAAGFSLTVDEQLPVELAQGASLMVSVTAAPTQAGITTATVLIATNDETTPVKEVVLRVEGYVPEQPGVQVSVGSFDFGTLTVGETQELSVTLTPENDAGLEINSAVLDPAVGGLTVTTDKPLPTVLFDASESLTVTVRFAPTTSGTFQSRLLIATNAADGLPVELPVAAAASPATSVGETAEQFMPELGVHPNPVAGGGTVSFALAVGGYVSIELYTLDGALVSTVFSGQAEPGLHSVDIDTGTLAAGAYLCRLTAGRETVQQFLLVQ